MTADTSRLFFCIFWQRRDSSALYATYNRSRKVLRSQNTLHSHSLLSNHRTFHFSISLTFLTCLAETDESWRTAQNIKENSKIHGREDHCYRYWKICTYNILSVKNAIRLTRLNSLLNENDIDCISLNETNWTGRDFSHYFSNYTWFGRKATRKQGGVGFLIKTCLIENIKVETFSGTHFSWC